MWMTLGLGEGDTSIILDPFAFGITRIEKASALCINTFKDSPTLLLSFHPRLDILFSFSSSSHSSFSNGRDLATAGHIIKQGLHFD